MRPWKLGATTPPDPSKQGPTALPHTLVAWSTAGMGTNAPRTVLLVEHDAQSRLVLGEWLEGAGCTIETCPGPTGPGYTCIGSRGGRCPLADSADVVVLDLRLASDIAMKGTPAWHLLTYYMTLGKPVIALVGDDDPVHPLPDEQVQVLPRAPTFDELIAAVRRATQRTTGTRS